MKEIVLNELHETEEVKFLKNKPMFIEFDKPENISEIKKGEIYSFINEYGDKEIGECVNYDKLNNVVTLKTLKT